MVRAKASQSGKLYKIVAPKWNTSTKVGAKDLSSTEKSKLDRLGLLD